jgi:hypothetical protein
MKLKSKKMYRIVFILGFSLLLLANFAIAANKISSTSTQNLQKPATFEETTINIGSVITYFLNTSVDASGEEQFGFNMGDPTAAQPSFDWLEGGYVNNGYLYLGIHRMCFGTEEVHFSGAVVEDWTVLKNDPAAKSAFQVSYSMDDALAGSYSKGISASIMMHAWSESYRDDFYIMEYDVTNNSGTEILDFYGWWHADMDISLTGGGSGIRAYSRDDMPGYFVGTDVNGNPETLSFMYDADNPNIDGDDTGGVLSPKEALGYIGSRIIDCPARTGQDSTTANTQSGHQWWDWNSDPDINIIGENARLAERQEFKADPGSPHDYRYMQIIGPLTIPAGGTIHYAIGIGIGEGLDGLRNNLQWANDIYWNDFQGPAAPTAPTVTLEKGDGVVTITWNDISESSADPLTGVQDFEGYRLYRSLDAANWTLLNDYDLVNNLGDNTGLPFVNSNGLYEFVDESVVNGFLYYYTVAAYDKGTADLSSLETGKLLDLSIEPGPVATSTALNEDAIIVVPNPFIDKAPWDFTPSIDNPAEERLQFQNVPLGSKITVFNLAGDKIIELEQEGTDGYVNWDLITRTTQKAVSGLYLYVVEAVNGDSFIDKFVIIR